jgi:uncharacterized membrane protein (DUF485 family)
MSGPETTRNGTGDILLAVLVMFIYFAYMLTIAFAPEVFAAPLRNGSSVSVGLALGLAMAIFMVALSAWYTGRRNSRETDHKSYETSSH